MELDPLTEEDHRVRTGSSSVSGALSAGISLRALSGSRAYAGAGFPSPVAGVILRVGGTTTTGAGADGGIPDDTDLLDRIMKFFLLSLLLALS